MKDPYPVCLVIQNIQDHVFTIMDKKDATDFHFPFIDQDVRSEIDNLANPNGPKFTQETYQRTSCKT
jgi:hypothetical protein